MKKKTKETTRTTIATKKDLVSEKEKTYEMEDLKQEAPGEEYIYYVKLSERELKNSRIRQAVIDLLGLRMELQKKTPYHKISSAEFELIKNTSLFTPRSKYKGKTYKGEVGKYRGRKLIVE